MPTLSPIRVKPGPTGWVLVILPFSPDRVQKIHTFSNRVWNDEQKCWAIPRTARTIDRLKALFSDDQIIIEPEARHPKPSHPGRRPAIRIAPGSGHDAVRNFAQNLRNEAYSVHTIKIYTRHAGRFLQITRVLPAELTPQHIQRYLQNLKQKERASATYHNQAIRALKSFCQLGLHKSPDFIKNAFPPREKPRSDTQD